jgi:hypothetical protein
MTTMMTANATTKATIAIKKVASISSPSVIACSLYRQSAILARGKLVRCYSEEAKPVRVTSWVALSCASPASSSGWRMKDLNCELESPLTRKINQQASRLGTGGG